jgi:hypothetical protein
MTVMMISNMQRIPLMIARNCEDGTDTFLYGYLQSDSAGFVRGFGRIFVLLCCFCTSPLTFAFYRRSGNESIPVGERLAIKKRREKRQLWQRLKR